MDDKTISVRGVGQAAAPPDLATLRLGVSVLANSVQSATQQAAAAANAVLEAVRAHEVEDRDLQTADYSVYAEHDHRNGAQVLRGYRVQNTVVVTVRNLDTLGVLLETATAAAGNTAELHGIDFGHSDPALLQSQARELAWQHAVSTAQQLADLAGVTLGSPISISEGGGSVARSRRMRSMAAMADAAPPMEIGESGLQITLNVVFAIAS